MKCLTTTRTVGVISHNSHTLNRIRRMPFPIFGKKTTSCPFHQCRSEAAKLGRKIGMGNEYPHYFSSLKPAELEVEQKSVDKKAVSQAGNFCSASLIFIVPGSNNTMATKMALIAPGVPKPPPTGGIQFLSDCMLLLFFRRRHGLLLNSRTHKRPVTISQISFPNTL